jgi:hypothetical protein
VDLTNFDKIKEYRAILTKTALHCADDLTDQHMQHLKGAKYIHTNYRIGDAGLAAIAGMFQKVSLSSLLLLVGAKFVCVCESPFITDTGLQSLKGVHTIDLSYNEHLTDEALKGLVNAKVITMFGCDNFTNQGFKYLSGVHTINIDCQLFGDEGIAALEGVHTISIYCTSTLTNNGLKALSSATNIELIDCVNVSNDGFKYFTGKQQNCGN